MTFIIYFQMIRKKEESIYLERDIKQMRENANNRQI